MDSHRILIEFIISDSHRIHIGFTSVSHRIHIGLSSVVQDRPVSVAHGPPLTVAQDMPFTIAQDLPFTVARALGPPNTCFVLKLKADPAQR